jgi:hypothetical protein
MDRCVALSAICVDSVDDDDDIECSENPFDYRKNQNKPRKNY